MTATANATDPAGSTRAAPPGCGLGRRALDVTVALLSLAVAGPLLAILALAVFVDSGRPVFFRQERVGEGGRRFTLLKLRTMRPGVGPGVTVAGDRRVTRVGAWLRATSMDELPQLLHVLSGRMTLVGPRPELPGLGERYAAQDSWVLLCRPGLTGPGQLAYRDAGSLPAQSAEPAEPLAGNGEDVEERYLRLVVPAKVAADAVFLAHPTVPSCLRWLAITFVEVLRPGRGGALARRELVRRGPTGPAPLRVRPREAHIER